MPKNKSENVFKEHGCYDLFKWNFKGQKKCKTEKIKCSHLWFIHIHKKKYF